MRRPDVTAAATAAAIEVPPGACDCHARVIGDQRRCPMMPDRVDTAPPASPLALVRSGKAYVKISGAYRVSRLGLDYADAAPLARALIAANPERIVWGTDWPHTNSARPPGRPASDVSPLQPIDDGRLLNQLPGWAPDAAIRRQILVDNPARLYGF